MRMFPPSRAALGCVLAALLAAAAPVAQADEARATLTVTGEATVTRAPDTASLSIGVTTLADKAGEAMAANAGAMAAVIARLKDAGVEGRDMQTSGLSLSPNWSRAGDDDGASRITGYTATNGLRVTIVALDRLGTVLDAAIADGANTLDGLSFALADPRPALDEARRQAVADARAKAELIADAAGVKLGAVMSVSEGGGYGGTRPAYRDAAMVASVPIEQGEVGYSAAVTIVWALEQ